MFAIENSHEFIRCRESAKKDHIPLVELRVFTHKSKQVYYNYWQMRLCNTIASFRRTAFYTLIQCIYFVGEKKIANFLLNFVFLLKTLKNL